MGYDMYVRGTIPGITEAVQAAKDQYDAALRDRDALQAEAPRWFSEAEEANLTQEEREALGKVRSAEMQRLMDEEGVDFWQARHMVGAVKPSEAWLAADRRVHQASAAVSVADKQYFRLNIWGMGKMRDSMYELGMLAVNYPSQDWPERPEGVDEKVLEEAWELEEEERLEHSVLAVREYFQAVADHKSWSPPDEPGLPVHKFGSNDGWLVTPHDIHGALAIFDLQQKENPDLVAKVRADWAGDDADSNTFDEWIAWLRIAEDFGGFEVY